MAGRQIDTALPETVSAEYKALWEGLDRCISCERPMRPMASRASEWPFTVAPGTTQQCKSCYNRSYTNTTAASARRQGIDGKSVKKRFRGKTEEFVRPVLPRAQVAARWTADERSAALLICGRAGNAIEAAELLETLGFFETDPVVINPNIPLSSFVVPKGDR